MSLPLLRLHPKIERIPFRRPFDPALELYYPFFEAGGSYITDESIHGHHGAWSMAHWSEGPRFPCVYFDGIDDYIEIADSARFKVSEFSYAFLLYTATSHWGTIWDDGTPAVSNYGVRIRLRSSTSARFGIIIGNGTTAAEVAIASLHSLSTWEHIVLTYKDRVGKCYINGAYDNEQTGTLDPAYDTAAERIGTTLYLGNDFSGYLGEIRFYSRCLEDFEVEALYRATV